MLLVSCVHTDFYLRDVVSAVYAMATWLAGWVAGWLAVCHSRYCVLTTKPILKLFQLAPIPNSKGTPSAGALNTRGWEKVAIFEGNIRLSRKQCKIGRWLLWNVNRKSWVPD